MMKKNKLYTMRNGMPALFVDRRSNNIFDGLTPGQSSRMLNWDRIASNAYGANYGDAGYTLDDYMNSKNWLGISKKNNPFSKGNLANLKDSLKDGAAGAALNTASNVVGSTVGGAIAGGKTSKAGKVVGQVGSAVLGLAGTAIGGPIGGAIGNTVGQVLGGVTDALWGSKLNEENIANVENKVGEFNQQGNASAGAQTNSDVMSNWGNADLAFNFNKDYIGSDGIFASKAADEFDRLQRLMGTGKRSVIHGLEMGVHNADVNQDSNVASNFIYALGGNMFNKGGKKFRGKKMPYITHYNSYRNNSIDAMRKAGFTDEEIDDWNINVNHTPGYKRLSDGKIATEPVGGVFGGGEFTGSGVTERWTPAYRPSSNDSFNEAYDEAREAGAETFMFGDKEYNTLREANPIREFNNRYVGAGRTEESVRQREGYGKDFGPVRGPLAGVPLITYAYGGPMDGAIGYGFMSDYLLSKNKTAENKNQMTNMFMGMPNSMFAFGGDMQTNSADFPTGLTHINAGGTHSENPNDGVQMGVDNEGTPNLVEEGETVYNDYVFSNRILADEATKQMFKLPKKKDITFAEISKKLEKEIAERPNDPISEAGFKAQMQTLEEQQERQKSEMEAERARAAFEALSPEEQQAVMQQVAQQQAVAEQTAIQQPSPEEMQMMQQQQAMQADSTQAMVGQEPPMMAEGGHLYAEGSKIRRGVYKALGFHTDKEFLDWARKHKLRGDDKWEMDEDGLKNLAEDDEAWQALISDPTFLEAVNDNPALVHAIKNDYDFGAYSPSASGNITFDDDRGNWDKQTVQGWWGSNDPAWKQVIEAHPEITEETNLSREQLADYLRNTDAFKRGTQWLQESENNRLAYLQRIINNPNAPKKAKEYALRFADANGWKQNAARDYETIFNNPSGRAANPGTYWKTPIEAVRGSQTGNFVINDDGTVEPIIGDVPADWTGAGNYSWATPESDYAYNYYRRPSAAASASPETPATKTPEEGPGIEPVRKWDGLRYAGLFGPAVGLGMQMAGIGRPDYGDLDAAVNSAGNYREASWMPRGDFAVYKPDDPWFYTSPIIAQANATQRAITNKVSPSKGAETLANSYNTIIGLGNAQRQALEHNFDKYMKVKQYNADIYKDNQREYGTNSRFNAGAYNEAAGKSTNARLHAAQQRLANDAGWYNSLYGNVSGLFKGLSDLGRENRETNWRNALVASGAFGAMDEDALVNADIAKYKRGKKSAKGGKINKKRGLTY